MSQLPSPPIDDVAALRRYFVSGAKSNTCLGVEHERIGVLADGRPLDFDHVIEPLLARFARQAGWQTVEERGRTIGLRRGEARVTLEPGGQVEFSDRPRVDARAVAKALEDYDAELAAASRDFGVTWLGLGFRPWARREEVPWVPKGRYRAMREYLGRRGRLAHDMMARTATVQANLDYASEEDAAEKMRLAFGVTSLVTALWANSPLREGHPTGYQSFRAACWLETDEDRCGLLPFVFAPAAPERLFADYTEWALDVPMIFLLRDGEHRLVEQLTFRRFLTEGLGGERATLADWEVHLSTLFPEVRLKRYLEFRGADAGPWDMVKALPAFYRGLLYDGDARRAAWSLVGGWSDVDRRALRREVPRLGLAARVGNRPILDSCRELVAIARGGLLRLGDDASLLEPVVEVAATGRTGADRILELYGRTGGEMGDLISGLRLHGAARLGRPEVSPAS